MSFKRFLPILFLAIGLSSSPAQAEPAWVADQKLDRRLGLAPNWRLPRLTAPVEFRPAVDALHRPLPPYAQQPLGATEPPRPTPSPPPPSPPRR